MLLCDLFEEAEQENKDLVSPYADEAEIPADAYPRVVEKIAALNKRAAKLKVPPVQLQIVEEIYKDVKKDEDGPARKMKYFKVKVIGESPKLAGWHFIATIEHKDSGNIIRAVPGQESNTKIRDFYNADPDYCDWCKTRRNRIDTFLVQNDNGEIRQIGRNCLTNFLGGIDPKAIIWYFRFRASIGEIINDEDERMNRGGKRRADYFTAESVLAVALKVAAKFGYVTSAKSQETGSLSTAAEVRNLFNRAFYDFRNMEEWEKEMIKADPAMTAKANEMIEWFKALPEQERESNNFMHSLNVLLNSQQISGRDLGFVVALIPTYKRAQENQLKASNPKSNEWLGAPGQKIAPTRITVTGTQDIPSDYGTKQLVRMEDEQGHTIIWWNSSANRMEQGKQYTITGGTVKKHDEFRGVKQTVLTRAKLTPV
jgi:hypothetical protein